MSIIMRVIIADVGNGRPVVVDVVTDSNELTMPPEIMPARAWGFAISKIKELVVSSSV